MELSEECKFLMCNLEKSFAHCETEVLTVKIEYPKFELPECGRAETIINRCVWGQVERFFHDASTILYRQAVCALRNSNCSANNGEGEIPFFPYDAVLQYQVTTCNECYISLYRDGYEYTGGAHGNTIRRSDTWCLKTARPVQVCDFFKPKSNYRRFILDEILYQADENMRKCPGVYFENYRKLITRYFSPNRFYLTGDCVAFYFQLYEIAPYAAGIITFSIPFEKLDCPPSCGV
ncbi:DUF3298 and DUF4163 domain-containing protein [Clostridium minihomine]|uniref:DUF3298 and DUF4163 domain-containing protein n=1 Tax=Clostridium minihomine TaxID=2045012 RepID=UPI000C75AFF3|nr:DUF3298 and DUF4163 domain-containing protein [Clostridium minihomine]